MRFYTEPKVQLLAYTEKYKEIIYLACRNCYNIKGFDNIWAFYKEEEAKRLITKLINHEHYSVIEHCNYTFYIEDVSRSCMTQLIRHRIVSYSISSQHYTKHMNYDYKELEIYPNDNGETQKQYYLMLEMIDSFYTNLINKGVPHFIAREILPNACRCNITMTLNARELRHIIQLRITSNNTPEIIKLAQHLLREANKATPLLFWDLQEKYGGTENGIQKN